MIKLYSYSHDWFAWRPVRLGFIGKGTIVWLNTFDAVTLVVTR